ncbi:MAG: YHS domain-containing (seleno)protein [Kiloniellales bacterium]
MKAKITRRSLRVMPFILAVALGLLTVMGPAHAMHPSGIINDTWDGIAIKGYDPVAYFTVGRAIKGSEEFTHEWLETKWLFASAENRDLFAADPLSYVPQYGGYCSDATYVENKADINPTAWRIVNGRLYLFYSEPGAAMWSADDHAVKEADAVWERVKAGLAQ